MVGKFSDLSLTLSLSSRQIVCLIYSTSKSPATLCQNGLPLILRISLLEWNRKGQWAWAMWGFWRNSLPERWTDEYVRKHNVKLLKIGAPLVSCIMWFSIVWNKKTKISMRKKFEKVETIYKKKMIYLRFQDRIENSTLLGKNKVLWQRMYREKSLIK